PPPTPGSEGRSRRPYARLASSRLPQGPRSGLRFGGERLRPPAILPAVLENNAGLRSDTLGEELDVVRRELAGHVAKLAKKHQLPDVQLGRDLADLFGDLVGRTDDHVALVDDALKGYGVVAALPAARARGARNHRLGFRPERCLGHVPR